MDRPKFTAPVRRAILDLFGELNTDSDYEPTDTSHRMYRRLPNGARMLALRKLMLWLESNLQDQCRKDSPCSQSTSGETAPSPPTGSGSSAAPPDAEPTATGGPNPPSSSAA